jgi:hypothetical protein
MAEWWLTNRAGERPKSMSRSRRAAGVRIAISLTAALLLFHTRAALPARQSPVLVARIPGAVADIELAGPTIAGSTVMWAVRERTGALAIRTSRASRTITVARLALPPVPAAANDPSYDVTVSQLVTALDITPAIAVFVRAVTIRKDPKCRHLLPPCGIPSIVMPYFGDVWQRQFPGAFRRIDGGPPPSDAQGCSRVRPVDASAFGTTIVYSRWFEVCGRDTVTLRRAEVVLLRGHVKRVVTRSSRPIGQVATAGGFLAWGEGIADDRRSVVSATRVHVYNIKRRRTEYQVGSIRPDDAYAVAFDLDANGALALVTQRKECPPAASVEVVRGSTHKTIRIFSASTPPEVRIKRNRLMLATAGTAACGDPPRQLVLVDRRGRTATLLRPPGTTSGQALVAPNFDFDGPHFAAAITKRQSPSGDPPTYVTLIYRGATGSR